MLTGWVLMIIGGYLLYETVPPLYGLLTAPKLVSGISLMAASWQTGQSAEDVFWSLVAGAAVGAFMVVRGYKAIDKA